MPSIRRYSFGDYTLDLDRGALLRGGEDVKLRPKSFEVLRLLVQRHGQLVTKDDLLGSVWAEVVVTDGAVAQCLIDVRRAIGDESQQVIRTVPRRGYILDVPVTEGDGVPLRTNEPARNLSQATSAPASPRRAIAVAAVVLALVAGGAALWVLRERSTDAIEAAAIGAGGNALAAEKSIAVLAFVNMSPEPDQEYFSDGISEEILNLLAKTPDLQVIARTSSFAFKGSKASVAEIAGNLNVTHVLEGSVRKTGNRVRITAQLIDAETSSHLWSQTYDRTLDDILAVQSEIAGAVTEALQIELLGASTPPSLPRSAAAYEQYLQGQFFFGRRAKGDMERAANAYREAIRIDPEFARAWAGLAGATWISLSGGEARAEEAQEQLRIAAEKAVELDPNDAEGHFRLANYYWWSRNPAAARVHYRRALALAPNSPLMLSTSAMELAENGDLEGAIARYGRVVALDPLSATQRHNYGHLLYAAGRFTEARAQLLKEVDLNPDAERGLLGLMLILDRQFEAAESWLLQTPEGMDRDQGMAMVNHALGRAGESDAALARLVERLGPWDHPMDAEVLAYRGEIDEAFRALQRFNLVDRGTDASRTDVSWDVRNSPFLKPLQSDPRWEHLLQKRTRKEGK